MSEEKKDGQVPSWKPLKTDMDQTAVDEYLKKIQTDPEKKPLDDDEDLNSAWAEIVGPRTYRKTHARQPKR